MTLFAVFCFLLITLTNTGRSFVLKHYADKLEPTTVCLLCGAGMLAGAAVLAPYALTNGAGTTLDHWLDPWIVIPGLLKGILLWAIIEAHQKLIKLSLSSIAYCYVMGGALIALVNYLIFADALSQLQWVGIVMLGLAGISFLLVGHISELAQNAKFYFFIQMGILVFLGMLDRLVLGQTDWFVYMVLAGLGFTGAAYIAHPKPLPNLPAKQALIVMVAWFIMELTFYMIAVTVLPVAIAMFAINMRVVILMAAASLKYKERGLTEQLAFALIGVVAAGFVLLG